MIGCETWTTKFGLRDSLLIQLKFQATPSEDAWMSHSKVSHPADLHLPAVGIAPSNTASITSSAGIIHLWRHLTAIWASPPSGAVHSTRLQWEIITLGAWQWESACWECERRRRKAHTYTHIPKMVLWNTAAAMWHHWALLSYPISLKLSDAFGRSLCSSQKILIL